MTKLKQILWFVIPTLIVIAFLILLPILSINSSALPSFVGTQQYFRLMLNDTVFMRAVLNSFYPVALVALAAGVVVFIIKMVIQNKVKLSQKPYYITMLATCSVSTLLFLVFNWLPNVFGYPSTDYSVDTLLMDKISLRLSTINLYHILVSIQLAIIVCFIFWLVELIIAAVKKQKAQ